MTELDKCLEDIRQKVIASIPDWRDASCYPKEESKEADVWAWQFLRRCESYWKDWAEFKLGGGRGILQAENNNIVARIAGWRWGIRNGIKDPTCDDWQGPIRFLTSPEVWIASFFDPYAKRRKNENLSMLGDTEVCLVFDPTLAHEAQLKSAGEILKVMSNNLSGFEKSPITKTKAPYPDYSELLRVLDSHLCGESPTRAAREILPEPNLFKGQGNAELYKRYNKLLTYAQDITQYRYLHIIAHKARSLT